MLRNPLFVAAFRALRRASKALAHHLRVQTRRTRVTAITESLRVASDLAWLTKISDGYEENSWTKKLAASLWNEATQIDAGEDGRGCRPSRP